jgi:VIT1/CCC1 family predicted Fe2+/Mn2+ transporter
LTSGGVDSWYHEKESAWLYRRVAAAEADPARSALFLKLAAAAEEQAAKWQLAAQRKTPGTVEERRFVPSLRTRIVARLLSRFVPTSLAQVGARHRSALGGGLRAAVFGVNDGLVSNVSLVLGVAGAGAASGYVLTAGLAGLLAGALSMAAGEYISVRSQREMYEHQIALEREELAEYPDEEAEELALIYQARGVALGQAREVSQALLANPEAALDVLAREELGLNPDDLGSPWQAASSSFVAFALGAAVPLAPFLCGFTGAQATIGAVAITLVALFAVGLGLSLFTGRDAVRSALRMVLIGGGAGAVSFLVGHAVGVVLG